MKAILRQLFRASATSLCRGYIAGPGNNRNTVAVRWT